MTTPISETIPTRLALADRGLVTERLVHTIQAYRSGWAAFIANECEDKPRIYEPAWELLTKWGQSAETKEGAIAALSFATEHYEIGDTPAIPAMMRAALGYLTGASVESASSCLSEGLADAIGKWQAAENAFRKEVTPDPKNDHAALWNAAEAAELAMIKEPCRSMEDVRAKARVALQDENVFDSLRNCGLDPNDTVLHQFLASLLGAVRQPPVDNGEK